MKVLLACEGQSEVYLLKDLIRRGYLVFSCPLLLEEPIRLRQLSEIAHIINLLPIDEEIIVYRVGDTLKEELSLSKFSLRSHRIHAYRVCTKTELEILIIINENMLPAYKKVEHILRPKSFLKTVMPDYDPEAYFSTHDMYCAIEKYKRIKKHHKDEMYLFDLLAHH